MITDVFSGIYETIFGIRDDKFSLIFSTLYNEWGYIKLGLTFLFIPLLSWFLFYYVWRYPYGKLWHWALWFLISGIVVFGCTWSLANTIILASNNQQLIDALNDPQSGYKQYASDLPLIYAMINTSLALVLGFICSLIFKRLSKVQMHLPF